MPLAIALDQENGSVNSLFDEVYIRQFPSAMGVVATGSRRLASEVATATGLELSAVGVNWILGPVLDVLTNARNQPLGVRATSDDPQEASSYGIEFMRGYQKAGTATCGKHFPSYGNLEFLGAPTDVPTITDSLEQLSQSALVPFRNAIAQGIDAMMVGGVGMASGNMKVMHACLSEQIVEDLLRRNLNFDGVVVSECLEMEALSHNIGLGGGTVMGVSAGCDVVLLCRSFSAQLEALSGLKIGVENGMIERVRIEKSLRRVLAMKSKYLSWEKALQPAGIARLAELQARHTALSREAYARSITVTRDEKGFLPLTKILEPHQELLLLTPLLKPLPATAAFKLLDGRHDGYQGEQVSAWEASSFVMSGERVFRELGRSLARRRNGRVLHTSYTANGIRPIHEELIQRASAVIVVVADAGRNLYQTGFTKHVSMICKLNDSLGAKGGEKPCIVVSVSSPYDFAMDRSTGSHICTYDFTESALQDLVKVLYGELKPTGTLPGAASPSQKLHQTRQHWLVEHFNEERDSGALDALLRAARGDTPHEAALAGVTSSTFFLRSPDIAEAHFVVRNSSTKELYGFCSTYYYSSASTGVIGAVVVDPNRRKLSIGHSLHNRALRSLMQNDGIKTFQLGSRLPNIYLGIPTADPTNRKRLRQWFANLGWNTSLSRPVCSMILRNLESWRAPGGLGLGQATREVAFDMISGPEYAEAILDHARGDSRVAVAELYKLALLNKTGCAVIRGRRKEDEKVVASILLHKGVSVLGGFNPALADQRSTSGGICAPVISPEAKDAAKMNLALVLLAIKQLQKQGLNTAVWDHVRPASPLIASAHILTGLGGRI